MTSRTRYAISTVALLILMSITPVLVSAQRRPYRMTDQQVAQVVPPGFYFQGQSALTQMRNAAAMRFGNDRYVIAGMVDTSGYAADVRAKYEGFLITDLPISIGGTVLPIGAYGFGFSNDGNLTVMDISGKEVLSVATTKDRSLKRPRPLMMMESGNGIRFYSGKDYAVIEAN